MLQKCYVSLVENLNIEDFECLKYSLSKGLGLGIVVGGSIMKVPQLLLSAYFLPSCAPIFFCRGFNVTGVSCGAIIFMFQTLFAC